MSYLEEENRKLQDEITVMLNGIEILETIDARNRCDSHTMESIAEFLKHLRRFKATVKLKETLERKRRSKEATK